MVAAGIAGGGTVLTDQAINPYTDTGTKLEIVDQSVVKNAGESTVLLDKTKPAMTLSKWSGQEALGVSYGGVSAAGSRAFMTDQMQWKSGTQEVHAYPIAATTTMEDGGMEFEVVLNAKPASNQFPFTISGYSDMRFDYQGALVPDRPGSTCTDLQCVDASGTPYLWRPENVVGSYAVYSKTKRDQYGNGLNYSTGKLFHIFRPKATDASGAWTWADMSYDEAGTLTVVVPQKFLDTATYPVVVDPTFGNTAQGASTESLGGGSTATMETTKITLSGTSANVSSISAWLQYVPGTESTRDTAWGMFRANGTVGIAGAPGTCITQPTCSITMNISNTTFAADTFSTTIPNLVAADYWIGGIPNSDGPGTGSANAALDTTGGTAIAVGDSFPTNPFTCGIGACTGGAITTKNFSYYATYTATDISPVLSAASVSPGVALFSTSPMFTFSATWSDADSSGVHTFACKGPTAATSGCDGAGTWASYTSTFDATNPKTLTYSSSDAPGIYQAYIFVCDASTCSNVIQTYFVIRPLTSNVIQMNGISSQKGGIILQP